MKKLVISMIAVVSAIIMCFALAGCSKDVKGNTYVFDDIKISMEGASDAEIEAAEALMKVTAANMSITFNDDGTCEANLGSGEGGTSYYKQDGKKVYIGATADFNTDDALGYLEVSGNKLKMTQDLTEEAGMKVTITLKKK